MADLNDAGAELLRALCRYVLQHGNVHRDARWAAELLGSATAGGPIPPEERENSIALVKLHAAKHRIQRARAEIESAKELCATCDKPRVPHNYRHPFVRREP